MKKISIGILTYNHERFIEDCLRSVFSSNYPNLEIIISDDCSKDKTGEIIENFITNVQSSHTIIFNKNKTNLGLAENFNKTFSEIATGDFLITLGGDDMIKEDYFEMALDYFDNESQLMMLDFNADIIDENGQVTKKANNLGYKIKFLELKNYLKLDAIPSFAPGRMIRKDLVRKFESISSKCPTEDSVLVLRALMTGKFARLNRDVILYRRHSKNISNLNNLKLLSNGLIISQYLNDLTYFFCNKNIKELEFASLLTRIEYEYRRRNIAYSDLSLNSKRLKFRLLKLHYYLNK